MEHLSFDFDVIVFHRRYSLEFVLSADKSTLSPLFLFLCFVSFPPPSSLGTLNLVRIRGGGCSPVSRAVLSFRKMQTTCRFEKIHRKYTFTRWKLKSPTGIAFGQLCNMMNFFFFNFFYCMEIRLKISTIKERRFFGFC